jgi:hypothetical protein
MKSLVAVGFCIGCLVVVVLAVFAPVLAQLEALLAL